MSSSHATPGGRQAVTYEVVESELQASRDHVDQVAVVGVSNEGVHITLTAPAAEVLAKILVQHFSAQTAGQLDPLDDFDATFWTRLSVDVLVAKAHALGASSLGQNVVYASKITPGARRAPLQLVVPGSPRAEARLERSES